MRLALINPPFDLFKEGYGTKRPISKGYLPPLGIGYIAAAAMKAGHQAIIVDAPAMNYDINDTKKVVERFDPDAIGIYSLTCTARKAGMVADAFKKEGSVPVILGGPHATCFPETALNEYASIDYVVVGEGENVINPLLKAVKDGVTPDNIEGVAYRKFVGPGQASVVVYNGKARPATDLDQIERPPRHLYPNDIYRPLPYAYRRLPASTIITARGCPYSKCRFCFGAGRMKERFRRHSVGRVIDEVEELYGKYGVREIVFLDDVFLFNESWIIPFCEELRKRRINIAWSCAARVDLINKRILSAARQAGCWGVFYGLESGVQELLDIINKGTTLEEARNAIRWTHESGLESRGSFMVALPGETPQLFKKTVQFAIDLDLTFAQFTATFPDPGTELYDIAMKLGRIGPYRGMNKATYVPAGYKSPEEVEEMTRMAYSRFYMRPAYVLKSMKHIRSFTDIKRYVEGFFFLAGLT